MHSPTPKRFGLSAFILLVVASFLAGYWIAARLQPETPNFSPSGAKSTAADFLSPAIHSGSGSRDSINRDAPRLNAGGTVDLAAIRQQMITALNEPRPTERWMLLAGVLQGLSSSNWQGVLQALDEERKLHGKEHAEERAFFIRRAGEVVGRDAVAYFLDKKELDAARSALKGWASTCPSDALEWLARQSIETGRTQFMGAAMQGLAMAEPDLAISLLEGFPSADRRKYTTNFVSTLVQTTGVEQAQHLVDQMIDRARAGGTLKEPYLSDIFRDLAAIAMRRAYVSGNIDPAIVWLNQHVGQPYVGVEAVRLSAEQLAQYDPLKALAWVDSVNARAVFPQPGGPIGYGTILNTWTAKAGLEPVANWLSSNPDHASYDRLASHFSAVAAVSNDPTRAIQFATSIKDAATRAAALEYIQQTADARAGKKR